jgi:lipopolysaccharide heptosyltransferase II
MGIQVRLLKAADRLLGRTAYRALLRHSRRKPPSSRGRLADPVRRILVLRPGGIGDAVLVFPMLQSLKEAFPQARLDVLAERRNAGLFSANDVADRVLAYDRNMGRELLEAIRGKYDLVVDTEQYHFLSAIVAYLTGAPVICGFDTQGRGGLFTHRVGYSDQVYEVHSFLGLARSLTGSELPFDPERPFFPVSEEHRAWASEFLGDSRSKLAVVSPGASMKQRRWVPDRYRRLIRWFLEKGIRVVVIGGPADVPMAREVLRGLESEPIVDLTGRTTLARTAAVIARADVYVSSDTGPLHIAYGVGTPTVHLFGSGILQKWAPAGSRYRAVHKALPCSPCTRYGYTPPCPYDVECMKRIEVEDVVARLDELFERATIEAAAQSRRL